MMNSQFGRLCAVSAALLMPLAAAAQGPGYFIPPGGGGQRPPAGAQPPRAPTAPQPPAAPPLADNNEQQPPPPLQVPLPPLPEIPDVPKGAPPPAAVFGILSVPDVLKASVAYQAAEQEIAARRARMNEDAAKEQKALLEFRDAVIRDRAKYTPDQIRQKERELEERVNAFRTKFAERNRIIQEAGQYVMAQIERTLEVAAQKVAAARGINFVLNRNQLLGTTQEFDLSPQVAEVLNKVLPAVVIPPDGVSVAQMLKDAPGAITAPPAPSAPVPLVVPPTTPAPAPAPAAPAPAPAPAPNKH